MHLSHLKKILQKHSFTGKKNDSFVLTGNKDGKLVQFVLLGLGSGKNIWEKELEVYRRAVARGIHLLKKLEIDQAIMSVPCQFLQRAKNSTLLPSPISFAILLR